MLLTCVLEWCYFCMTSKQSIEQIKAKKTHGGEIQHQCNQHTVMSYNGKTTRESEVAGDWPAIYRTRVPSRPSSCCSCNLSQSLSAERCICFLWPPASRPTSTNTYTLAYTKSQNKAPISRFPVFLHFRIQRLWRKFSRIFLRQLCTLRKTFQYTASRHAVISDVHVRYLLSPVRLSVCNVRAPYSGGWNFWPYFYGIRYLGHPLTCTENFMEIVAGEAFRRGVKPKRGSKI